MSKREKLVIIGSGIAGLTAAIYASRGDLEPVVFEGREPGGQLTLTSLVENYPGFPDGVNGFDLVQNMHKQAEKFGTRYLAQNVEKIDLKSRPFTLTLDDGETMAADSIIIASGARARTLNLEKEKEFWGAGLSTCAVCDAAFYRDQDVVVVGGGDSAMEDSLFLTKYAKTIRLIHRRNSLRASKIMQDRVLASDKIEVIWDSEVVDILGTNQSGVQGVRIRNVKTGKEEELKSDGLFMAIGHIPNTDFLNGQLPTDDQGYLISEGVKTKIPGVFVAGDVADREYQQAVTAAGSGCQAALEVEAFLSELE